MAIDIHSGTVCLNLRGWKGIQSVPVQQTRYSNYTFPKTVDRARVPGKKKRDVPFEIATH